MKIRKLCWKNPFESSSPSLLHSCSGYSVYANNLICLKKLNQLAVDLSSCQFTGRGHPLGWQEERSASALSAAQIREKVSRNFPIVFLFDTKALFYLQSRGSLSPQPQSIIESGQKSIHSTTAMHYGHIKHLKNKCLGHLQTCRNHITLKKIDIVETLPYLPTDFSSVGCTEIMFSNFLATALRE